MQRPTWTSCRGVAARTAGSRLTRGALASALALTAFCGAITADARVARFIVEDRQPYAGGAQFGTSGAFERLVGIAHFEVDPGDPVNAVIVNLDKAPRNAQGMVEFTSPFWLLKPVDMAKGNRKLHYSINNRGNSELLQRANADAVPTLLRKRLELGFAHVDAGWHGDGIPNPNQLFPDFPIATNGGAPITGRWRIEYQPTITTFDRPIGQEANVRLWRAYPAADLNTANATLTVRDRQDAPKTPIPSDQWAFGTCPTGQASLVPSATDLCLFSGFQANKMYELIYTARDPIVMGLAYAVTRDVGSFLRFQTHDDVGNPNPLAQSAVTVGIRRAYSYGVSSTGMYQREFLYLGFNEDEAGRKVFDGVTIHTAGAYRLFANVQFAHPTYYSRQDFNQDFTSNAIPPFTFAVTTDPITGITDGLVKRPGIDPLVMQIDGGLEMWQWKATLNSVDGLGNPVPVPPNVRLYYMPGTSHVQTGTGVLSASLDPAPPGVCQYGLQRNASINALARALVVAMDQWADQGIPPPRSNYPRAEQGLLVTLQQYQASFPDIPGVDPPVTHNPLSVLDFGPRFGSQGGIEDILPPVKGAPYQVLQVRADADGNDMAIIEHMEVAVPLGTQTGWNVRAAPRAPDLCGLSGAYFPFANTLAERQVTGDPRPSLQERYGSHAGFVQAIMQHAKRLVRERYMLKEDADRYIQAAEASPVLR